MKIREQKNEEIPFTLPLLTGWDGYTSMCGGGKNGQIWRIYARKDHKVA